MRGMDEYERREDGPGGCATGRISGDAMIVIGLGTWRTLLVD